jgi:hypothetical protein
MHTERVTPLQHAQAAVQHPRARHLLVAMLRELERVLRLVLVDLVEDKEVAQNLGRVYKRT